MCMKETARGLEKKKLQDKNKSLNQWNEQQCFFF